MSIVMQMSFDEAIDFLQFANAKQNNQVTLIFDDEQRSLLAQIKDEMQAVQSSSEPDDKTEFVDFTKLPAFGMWADREEMADSVEYVRKLRREQWTRHDT